MSEPRDPIRWVSVADVPHPTSRREATFSRLREKVEAAALNPLIAAKASA